MIDPVTIAKKKADLQGRAQDFSFLRQHALNLIQDSCGAIWTDYNLHDPGVTIVEQLCFAITDLAYRTDIPIEDLLANETGAVDYKANSFYKPEEILFSSPVSVKDFRKVLIDEIAEIDNIWMEPVRSSYASDGISGVYRTYVQVNTATAELIAKDAGEEAAVKQKVKAAFMSKRNLCEDLSFTIHILKPIAVTLEAEIVIDNHYQPEKVLAEIYSRIEFLFSEKVPYHTPEELLATGYSQEEIYNGPRLKKGIILDKDLRERNSHADPAELSQLVMSIGGVFQVNQLNFTIEGRTYTNEPYQLDADRFMVLSQISWGRIKLITNRFVVNLNHSLFQNFLKKARAEQNRQYISVFYNSAVPEIEGRYRNPRFYHSLQNEFPHIYGLGKSGMPKAERTDKRLSEVNQLKAYLLFFEQLLANYVIKLANIEQNFSPAIHRNDYTQFQSKPLYDVPGISDILRAYTSSHKKIEGKSASLKKEEERWRSFKNAKDNSYEQRLSEIGATKEEYTAKRLRQLDHMLARFNEVAVDFPIKLFRQLYMPELTDNYSIDELAWKSMLLQNVTGIGYARTRGVDMLNEGANEFDFEKRIRFLLCMRSSNVEKGLVSVFNHKKMKFEKKSSKIVAASKDDPPATIDASNLFLSPNEYDNLKEHGLIASYRGAGGSIYFHERNEALFMEAVRLDNFRIARESLPGATNKNHLLFRYRNETKWQVIGHFSNDEESVVGLKKLLKYFRSLSINSEGLYIIEHILLRPPLSSPSFKFRVKDKNGRVIANLADWVSFDQREAILRKLKSLAGKSEDEQIDDAISTQFLIAGDQEADVLSIIKYSLNEHFANMSKSSLLEMVVRGKNDSEVPEIFYGFQISVILPTWPARFQDASFQGYMKNLIMASVPAHIKVTFEWFSPDAMRSFEEEYKHFRERFKADDISEKQKSANELIEMLLHT